MAVSSSRVHAIMLRNVKSPRTDLLLAMTMMRSIATAAQTCRRFEVAIQLIV
jgi:hypothetical protein